VEAALGALLGTFAGDALGEPFEGTPYGGVPEGPVMLERALGRGRYTDDTQMMVALAESLLRCDVIDEDDLAATFRAHYDPSRGYGAGTAAVLELWEKEVPIAEAANRVFGGQGSLGNGAAMRVAPVGVRFFDDHVLLATQARRSARITHAHPVGIDSAATQAAAVAAAMDGGDIAGAAVDAARTAEVQRALDAILTATAGGLHPRLLSADGRGVPATGPAAVAAAVAAADRAGDVREAVTVAIRAGGDTDTTGAMAGAIAGARFGGSAIPGEWLAALEDGVRGRTYVTGLARELGARAAKPAAVAFRPQPPGYGG
jgi:poly(ADP-ribose) glycohydrolase ARH3